MSAAPGNTPPADFYVGSIYNSPDPNQATLLRNDGSEFAEAGGPAAAGPGGPRQPAVAEDRPAGSALRVGE